MAATAATKLTSGLLSAPCIPHHRRKQPIPPMHYHHHHQSKPVTLAIRRNHTVCKATEVSSSGVTEDKRNYNYIPATKRWKINAKAKGFNGSNLEKTKVMVNEEKMKKMKEDADADDKIPDVVMERMIGRILFNVGVPLVTGLGLLQVFSVIKEQNLWQIPRWLPFLTTFITFGASTLGIAYGTLSTSWDAENKGSVLGFEEAKKNWVQMWEEDDSGNT